jgi:hypothetical protein
VGTDERGNRKVVLDFEAILMFSNQIAYSPIRWLPL